jgi:uncharacterized membrane protein
MNTPTPVTGKLPRMKLHWHVLFTHFPVSFFTAAFGFQFLHLFIFHGCMDLASNIMLITGAILMIPTTLTGWNTWKRQYKAARVMVFNRKIRIAFAMLGFSILLVIWRQIYYGITTDIAHSISHWVYLVGIGLLMVGSFLEGYYGGRLNHR